MVATPDMIPLFKIGDYTFYPANSGDPDKVWIDHVSGEGGDFSKKELMLAVAKAIEEFYNKNF